MSLLLGLVGRVTGNPMLLVWIAIGAFVAGVVTGGGAAWKVQGWRLDAVKAEFKGFVDTTRALGKAAATEKKRIEDAHIKTTKEIKDAIPKQIAAARSHAVRNYIARLPVSASGSGVSSTAHSAGGINAPRKEPVAACRPEFIEDAAQDAATLTAWQDWARQIGFPVR